MSPEVEAPVEHGFGLRAPCLDESEAFLQVAVDVVQIVVEEEVDRQRSGAMRRARLGQVLGGWRGSGPSRSSQPSTRGGSRGPARSTRWPRRPSFRDWTQGGR